MTKRTIVRCRDCELYDPNPIIVTHNIPKEAIPDPDWGVCRAKLPNVVLGNKNGQPIPISFQPPMHKDWGCAEGEPKDLVRH